MINYVFIVFMVCIRQFIVSEAVSSVWVWLVLEWREWQVWVTCVNSSSQPSTLIGQHNHVTQTLASDWSLFLYNNVNQYFRYQIFCVTRSEAGLDTGTGDSNGSLPGLSNDTLILQVSDLTLIILNTEPCQWFHQVLMMSVNSCGCSC